MKTHDLCICYVEVRRTECEKGEEIRNDHALMYKPNANERLNHLTLLLVSKQNEIEKLPRQFNSRYISFEDTGPFKYQITLSWTFTDPPFLTPFSHLT